MSAIDHDAGFRDGARPRRRLRVARLLLAAGLAGAAALGAADLARFAATLPRAAAAMPPPADAIVALTGGEARVDEGLDLLAARRGRRLLISGVGEGIRAEDLAERGPDGAERARGLFGCCVDLGHAAQNTVGNAAETAAWARSRRYGSLIVVTARYHMPRALAEIAHALPEARLAPWPVEPPSLDLDAPWRDPRAARLVATEWVKYRVAGLRMRLGLGAPGSLRDPAAAPPGVAHAQARGRA